MNFSILSIFFIFVVTLGKISPNFSLAHQTVEASRFYSFLFHLSTSAKIATTVKSENHQQTDTNSDRLLAFETSNYWVEIRQKKGQPTLSIYDKKAMTWLLQKVNLEFAKDNWGIGYWYRENLRTFRIYQRKDGYRWLTIQYLGQQGEEIWEAELPAE